MKFKTTLKAAFAVLAALSLTLSGIASGELLAQKKADGGRRGRETIKKPAAAPVVDAPAAAPQSASKTAVAAPKARRAPASGMLFDASEIDDLAQIRFFEMYTSESEFRQTYRPLADSASKFSDTLKKSLRSANEEFYTFRVKYASKFSAERDRIKKMMDASRDAGRRESLESLMAAVLSDQRGVLAAERGKIRAKVESAFSAFSQAFAKQRSFMTSGTSYESEKDFNSALDSFESGIRSKRTVLGAAVDAAFSSLEVELLK